MARVHTLALALALVSSHRASGFSTAPIQPSRSVSTTSALESLPSNEGECSSQDRRAVLSSLVTVTSATLGGIAPAYAGLLDDYGADPSVDKQPKPKVKEQAVNKGKAESNMEPNLRSNYYYPTNKGM